MHHPQLSRLASQHHASEYNRAKYGGGGARLLSVTSTSLVLTGQQMLQVPLLRMCHCASACRICFDNFKTFKFGMRGCKLGGLHREALPSYQHYVRTLRCTSETPFFSGPQDRRRIYKRIY